MLDHMFRRRALVYYDNSAGTIHVSGHASQEEQRLILRLVKPKYFHSGARRVPASVPSCGAGTSIGRGVRRNSAAGRWQVH